MPLPRACFQPVYMRWWWAAALMACMGCVEYLFFVRYRPGQWTDQASFNAWVQWWPREESIDPLRVFLDALPQLCVIAAAVFMLYRVVRDRSFLRGIVAGTAALAAAASTQLLKHQVLERPDYNFGTVVNSFPSGHTTVAAAAMGLAYVIAPPRLRPMVQSLAWSFAIATGVATLVAGWHRPSDIAAGFLMAGFWMVLATAVLQRRQPLASTHRYDGVSRVLGASCLVMWTALLAAALVLPHPHIQRLSWSLSAAYGVLGVVHILAVGLLVGFILRSVVVGPMRTQLPEAPGPVAQLR